MSDLHLNSSGDLTIRAFNLEPGQALKIEASADNTVVQTSRGSVMLARGEHFLFENHGPSDLVVTPQSDIENIDAPTAMVRLK